MIPHIQLQMQVDPPYLYGGYGYSLGQEIHTHTQTCDKPGQNPQVHIPVPVQMGTGIRPGQEICTQTRTHTKTRPKPVSKSIPMQTTTHA
jgi:hypothetical protein